MQTHIFYLVWNGKAFDYQTDLPPEDVAYLEVNESSKTIKIKFSKKDEIETRRLIQRQVSMIVEKGFEIAELGRSVGKNFQVITQTEESSAPVQPLEINISDLGRSVQKAPQPPISETPTIEDIKVDFKRKDIKSTPKSYSFEYTYGSRSFEVVSELSFSLGLFISQLLEYIPELSVKRLNQNLYQFFIDEDQIVIQVQSDYKLALYKTEAQKIKSHFLVELIDKVNDILQKIHLKR